MLILTRKCNFRPAHNWVSEHSDKQFQLPIYTLPLQMVLLIDPYMNYEDRCMRKEAAFIVRIFHVFLWTCSKSAPWASNPGMAPWGRAYVTCMSAFWHFIECTGKGLIQVLSLTNWSIGVTIGRLVEEWFITRIVYYTTGTVPQSSILTHRVIAFKS